MIDWKEEIRRRLAGLKLEPTREREIVEELSQHLEDRYLELVRGGALSEAASREVFTEVLDGKLLAQGLRRTERQISREPVVLGTRRRKMIEDLHQDLRYGLRSLRKNPGFTLVAVLLLALGIGANTAIFSVVSAVLLRPLDYYDPDRIVMIWESEKGGDPTLVSPANFVDWREQSQSLARVAALRSWDGNLMGADQPERIQGALATADLFEVLGVNALIGRTFAADEDQPGHAPVVVLSYGIWQRRFGGDPGVVGRIVTINGRERTVIGVMPSSFKFTLLNAGSAAVESEMWAPMVMEANYWNRRDLGQLRVIARMNADATTDQAQAEISAITARQQSESSQRVGVHVIPLRLNLVNEARPALLLSRGARLLESLGT
jgi:putative ABC transport system permease protein